MLGNWGIGVMGKWGVVGLGKLEVCMTYVHPYIHTSMHPCTHAISPNTPIPHHPIIPVWNMQNGGLEIPYYQQFVEFPLHKVLQEVGL
jgi:hypothetical protein